MTRELDNFTLDNHLTYLVPLRGHPFDLQHIDFDYLYTAQTHDQVIRFFTFMYMCGFKSPRCIELVKLLDRKSVV